MKLDKLTLSFEKNHLGDQTWFRSLHQGGQAEGSHLAPFRRFYITYQKMKEIGPYPRNLCPFQCTPGHPSLDLSKKTSSKCIKIQITKIRSGVRRNIVGVGTGRILKNVNYVAMTCLQFPPQMFPKLPNKNQYFQLTYKQNQLQNAHRNVLQILPHHVDRYSQSCKNKLVVQKYRKNAKFITFQMQILFEFANGQAFFSIPSDALRYPPIISTFH